MCRPCVKKSWDERLREIQQSVQLAQARIRTDQDAYRAQNMPSSSSYRAAVAEHEQEMAEAMSWWKMGG